MGAPAPRRRTTALLATAAVVAALPAATAHAATFTVGDGNVSALKAAIATANANDEDNVISLAPNGRYVLTSVDNRDGGANGLPALAADDGNLLTIEGNGATIARLASGPDLRLLRVTAGANVTVRRLTLTGGRAAGEGGAILNSGTLTVTDSTLTQNAATGTPGGAGASGGSTGGAGGAGGVARGGAISSAGTLSLLRSTLTANTASGGAGGGGGAGSSTGGNGGAGGAASGAAVFVAAGTATLTNATFSDNRATGGRGGSGRDSADVGGSGGAGGAGQGGAIAVASPGTATIVHATATGNSVAGGDGGRGGQGGTSFGSNGVRGAGAGGGLAVIGGAVARPRGSIFAQNSAAGSTPAPDVAGRVASGGFNLVGDRTGATGFAAAGDQSGTAAAPLDPQLGPLGDNGGPVATRALLAGSPALDAGGTFTTPATDARAVNRPQPAGGRSDIGAYEHERAAQAGPVYTVRTRPDVDDGVCGVQNCSLREAIAAANAHPNGDVRDRIEFALPGDGVQTLAPSSPLPAITDPLAIDGYTQRGAAPATATTPAVLRIALQGASAGSADGLVVVAGPSRIRGLVISGFSSGLVLTGSGGSTVEGNRIGTTPDATAAAPNRVLGLAILGSSRNVIGGTTAAAANVIAGSGTANVFLGGETADGNGIRGNAIGTNTAGARTLGGRAGVLINEAAGTLVDGNLISGNAGHGVDVRGAAPGTVINHNRIGTDAAGTGIRSNAGDGVNITASGVRVGGTVLPANTIAFNAGAGVRVDDGTQNPILGNAIFGNAEPGIALGRDVVANDPGDADTGPNGLQNHPELLASANDGAATLVRGQLDSLRSTAFRIELFASSGARDLRRVGVTSLTTPSTGGPAPFTVSVPASSARPGETLTATATRLDTAGRAVETSALSPALRLCSRAVTTTADTGPGSLREAIECANTTPNRNGPDTIRFAIPIGDPGYDATGQGVFVIRLGSSLPPLTEAAVVDGYTQPGDAATAKPAARPNRLATGDDAVIKVQLAPAGSQTAGPALDVDAAGSTVRGLSIVGFNFGVFVDASDSRFTGNFVGLAPGGSVLPVNLGFFVRGSDNVIGGVAPGDRNVFAGREFGLAEAILLNGNRNAVLGNHIGTDRSGRVSRPYGIGVRATGEESRIGGVVAGAANVIAADSHGIQVSGLRSTVLGNFVGTDRSGTARFVNGIGIYVDEADGSVIGGTGPGERNVVANSIANRGLSRFGSGIVVTQALGVTIRGNSIRDNAGLAIDLEHNLISENDAGDDDGLQNFPRLAGVGTEADAGRTTVVGLLDSRPQGSYVIDVYDNASCDGSGHGEAARYLGSQTVETDSGGAASFTVVLPLALADGRAVAATATNLATGSTSELSECRAAAPLPVPVAPAGLRAQRVASDEVVLRWTDRSVFEDGFRVERAEVHGHSPLRFKPAGVAARDATAFADADVKHKRTYVYRVVAFNRAGDSVPSEALTVTTPRKRG